MQPYGNKPQPCKFGMDCKFYKQGKCRNYHDANMNGPNNGPKGNPNSGGYGNPKYGGYGNPHKEGYGHQDRHSNGPNNRPQNDGSNAFCKFFQWGECNKPKCNKLHGFTRNNNISRIMYTQDMPIHPSAALGLFSKSGTNYFALRNGNKISFYLYKL